MANVFLLGLVMGCIDVSTSMAAEPPQGIVVGAGVRRFSFPPPAEMTQADVYTWGTSLDPRAVLVLCPGFNGNGEGLVRQPAWQEFASTNHLALCAISFVSPETEVRAVRGYIQAPRGSGDLLLKAIRLGFGRDLPILIYGFSCGGHFALSVAGWVSVAIADQLQFKTGHKRALSLSRAGVVAATTGKQVYSRGRRPLCNGPT